MILLGAAFTPPVLAALGIAAARVASRSRERARQRALLAIVEAPIPARDLGGLRPGTVATVEGVIGAESPAVVSFHPFGTTSLEAPNVYARTRATKEGALTLVVDGKASILIEGESLVVVGSTETEHRAPLDRAADLGVPALATDKVSARTGQFRSVKAGDRVRVRGALAPAPDDAALYRDFGAAFRMTPPETTDPTVPRAVLFAATLPSSTRLTPARGERTVLVFGVLLGIAVALLVLFTIRTPNRAYVTLAEPTAVAPHPPIAACRTAVLDRLAKNLDPAPALSGCSDPYAQAVVSFADGRFADASASFVAARAREPELVPSLTEAESHLFVHDFARSASVVRTMVGRFYVGPETAEKRYLECIASVLEARAEQADGGPGPISHYHWMNTDYRKICSQRPFAQFARELAAEGNYFGAEDMKAWQQHVYAAAGAYDVVGTPVTAPLATRARLAARPIALEKHFVDRLLVLPPGPDDHMAFVKNTELGRANLFSMEGPAFEYTRMTGFAADVALFFAYSGFPERNAPYWKILDGVAHHFETGQTYHVRQTTFDVEEKLIEEERTFLSYVMSHAASAALVAGDLARVKRYLTHAEVHSARIIGELVEALVPGSAWEDPSEDRNWHDHQVVFAAGTTGDGARVVEALQSVQSTGRDTLPRVIHHVRSNRGALDAWFATAFPAPCVGCGASTLHGHAVDRAAVGTLLGGASSNEAARLRPSIVRFTDALVDPVIAFELDELETFFAAKR